jgi:zinc transporter
MQQDASFEGFAFGFQIDANGAATPLAAAVADGSKDYWVWISLDPLASGTRAWLESKANLAPEVVNALMVYDSQPRCLVSPQGAFLNMRGINTAESADPTDLVSLRLWIENDRIITVHRRPLATIANMRAAYETGHGPKSSAELIVALASGMIDRIRDVVQGFETEVDTLEDECLHGELTSLRVRLNDVRHGIVPLRRYLTPQHDAFVALMNANMPWIDDWWRSHLREMSYEVGRHIDALGSIRETANIVQDTLNSRLAERTNKALVWMTIGAAAFLPLNLLVGLLGSNVGGIPGAQAPYAFWVVVSILAGLVLVEFAVYKWLRKMRWI